MISLARYRVICDLDAKEYEGQQLVRQDPRRHPPLLEMFSRHGSRRFNEGHISRIAAEALAATGDEPDDSDQQRLEDAVSSWPVEKSSIS